MVCSNDGLFFCFFSNGRLRFRFSLLCRSFEFMTSRFERPVDLSLCQVGHLVYCLYDTPFEVNALSLLFNFLGLFSLVVSINKLHALLTFHNTATKGGGGGGVLGLLVKKEVAPNCRRVLIMLATHLKNSFILYSTLEFHKYYWNP